MQALELVQTHYSDFGPTLAHEYLTEQHGLKFSVETLRQWMIADGICTPSNTEPAFIKAVLVVRAMVSLFKLMVTARLV